LLKKHQKKTPKSHKKHTKKPKKHQKYTKTFQKTPKKPSKTPQKHLKPPQNTQIFAARGHNVPCAHQRRVSFPPISGDFTYKTVPFYVFSMQKSTLGVILAPKNGEKRRKMTEIRPFF
jgi:hypothetical protein